MISKQLTMVCLSLGLVAAPVTRAAADDRDLLGGAIVNEANKKRQSRTVYYSNSVSSAERAERRETPMALNYFGFPAGPPNGVLGLGRNSQIAIASCQLHMGYPSTGNWPLMRKTFF
jgi:hypothetical protein